MGPCATHWQDGMTTTSPFRFSSSGSSAPCRIACLARFIGTPLFTQAAVKPMADLQISQARRRFRPRVTLITAGTRATFPNFDTVRHPDYSFSPTKTFELELCAGVPGTELLVDKPAVAMPGCNIHDRLAAWVVVADTPWFAGDVAHHAQLAVSAEP